MEGIVYIDKLMTPADGKLLVQIKDEYSITSSPSGILLANAAHKEAQASSRGFNLHEWIIRSGKVVKLPERLEKGSYDWTPVDDIKEGDIVFWPIIRFFDYPVFKTTNDDIYLLVDYMDIYGRICDGDDDIVPVNGFYMFSANKEVIKALDYEFEKDSMWYTLEKKCLDIVYDEDQFNYPDLWQIGSKCMLMVPPIQLESNLTRRQDKHYYMAQKRHILAAIC